MSGPRQRHVAVELLVQFFLIGVAVFLGLQADQWRENREHRDKARATLMNFRTEIAKNRVSILAVKPYHDALRDSLSSGLTGGTATIGQVLGRFRFEGRRFGGIRSVNFARTSWELALATEALSYIEPTLAFEIAAVYQQQANFQEIQSSFLQNLFTPDYFKDENGRSALIAIGAYIEDVAYQEPHMLELYDRLQPKLDSALGMQTKAADDAASASSAASPARP